MGTPRTGQPADLPTLLELRALLVDDRGTLAPGSALYEVMSHPLAFVAGEAQALVTVRHADIACVIAEHTGMAGQPFERVQRTRALMLRLEFGSSREAELAARTLWRVHDGLVATDEGRVLRASDPDLLAILMVMGQLCSATWSVLMHGIARPRDVKNRADELFARMWQDREPSRSSLGIPGGHLPDSPGDAVDWVMAELDRRWRDDARANELADIARGLPRAYVESAFSARWAPLLGLPAMAVTQAATAAAVLALRGPMVPRAPAIASGRTVAAGCVAARGMHAAISALPDPVARRWVFTPTSD